MSDQSQNEVDLEQQNVGPASEAGGGEWPDPDAPPTGPASGEHHRSGRGDPMPTGTGTEPGRQQDDTTGGDRGPTRSTDAGVADLPTGFKDVLEADPVVGGSGSTPHDDDPRDRDNSPDPSAGGP